MTQTVTAGAQQAPERQPIRAALGAFVGTMIEWYDFYVYGTAAALVFGDVFFKSEDRFMGIIASLGTFAIGFVAVRSAPCCSAISATRSGARTR